MSDIIGEDITNNKEGNMDYLKIIRDYSVELIKSGSSYSGVRSIVADALRKHGLSFDNLPETDDGTGVSEKAFLQIVADLRFSEGNELAYGDENEAYYVESAISDIFRLLPEDYDLPMSTHPIESIAEYNKVQKELGLK